MDLTTSRRIKDLLRSLSFSPLIVCLLKKSKVCLLKKSLYGLKQSLRQLNKIFNDFLMRIGFLRSSYDSCVYMLRKEEQCIIFLLLYVDYILIDSSNKDEISILKKRLSSEFKMKDLGTTMRILKMDIVRD